MQRPSGRNSPGRLARISTPVVTISSPCQTASVPAREFPLDRPLDLARTLGLLVRGRGDRTIRLAADGIWWTITLIMGFAALLMTAFIIWSVFD